MSTSHSEDTNPRSGTVPDQVPTGRASKAILRDKRLVVSLGFIIAVLLAGIFAPIVAPYSPSAMHSRDTFLPPSWHFLLGTDNFGRDILSLLIWGTRVTMFVALGSVLMAAVGGIVIGLVAAYYGGWVDVVLMRLMDATLTLPPIVLAVFVVAYVGTSLINVTVVIGILFMPQVARVVYGASGPVKASEYIEAMRAMGVPSHRMLLRGILPNIAAPIIVQASLLVGQGILVEAGLSFLGLGPPPTIPSWGAFIQESYQFMSQSPWVILWPSLTISLSVIAFNLVGDSLRGLLDPRLRGNS